MKVIPILEMFTFKIDKLMETQTDYYHALGFFLGPIIGWVIMISIPFTALTIAQGMAIGAVGGFFAGHLIDKGV